MRPHLAEEEKSSIHRERDFPKLSKLSPWSADMGPGSPDSQSNAFPFQQIAVHFSSCSLEVGTSRGFQCKAHPSLHPSVPLPNMDRVPTLCPARCWIVRISGEQTLTQSQGSGSSWSPSWDRSLRKRLCRSHLEEASPASLVVLIKAGTLSKENSEFSLKP